MTNGNRTPDPTPSEIANRAKRIQSKWSDMERQKRSGRTNFSHWTPPVCHLDEAEHGDCSGGIPSAQNN